MGVRLDCRIMQFASNKHARPLLCVLYSIIFQTFAAVHADEWGTPSFLENRNEKSRVQFKETGSAYQVINMDEGIKEEIIIAFLNYSGVEEPIIGKFSQPNKDGNVLLGAAIKRSAADSNWGLVITKAQDYDNHPKDFRYIFDVHLKLQSNKVVIYINNIDDNPPYIQAPKMPCKIEENWTGPTNCIFIITDADGIMENTVKYISTAPEGVFGFSSEIQNGLTEWPCTLVVLKPLDFEAIALYLFDLTVEDSGGNQNTVKVMVEVIDQPDCLPAWTKIFASKQFKEKEEQTFQIEAVDGDIQIKDQINYSLKSEFAELDLFYINSETGELKVRKIDRDKLQREVFTIQVTAFEVSNITSSITQNILFIVDDINDHSPVITVEPAAISIPENTATALEFKVTVEDADLGDHAAYTVALKDNSGTGYEKAFQIVPDSGYQKWNFTIIVQNSLLLDYENKAWRNIQLQIHVVETADLAHVDSKIINILLIDVNDEIPQFEGDYNIEHPEDMEIGEIITVKAIDEDENDKLKYSLIGKMVNELFSIGEESGIIKTKTVNSFDYEKQQEVIIQIAVEDLANHKAYTQLIIRVTDVNDESPKIFVAENPISIKEAQNHGTIIIMDDIRAADEDTTALLKFSIDWDRSYALKNGRRASTISYNKCLIVNTEKIADSTQVKAVFVINEIIEHNTPDYERFDTLYIALVVKDEAQQIGNGFDKVTIPISIEDINDNKPKFVEDSLINRNVVEHADNGTVIGTVVAIDEDGPDNNVVSYSICPSNSSTPENWIDIHQERGELYVNVDREIDADDGPLWSLNYTVTATDGENNNTAVIIINIIDTNDKTPVFDTNVLEKEIFIFEECANGTEVLNNIEVSDADRDEHFHTVWFSLSPEIDNEVINFFSIDSQTGKVYVDYKKPGNTLDRESTLKSFNILFTAADNYERRGGIQLSKSESYRITLLDINDNDPIIEDTALFGKENYGETWAIGIIRGTDADDPSTGNGKFKLSIVAPKDLFYLSDTVNREATLFTKHSLRGYHGEHNVLIKATDFGEESRSSEKVLIVDVEKFNFEAPVFTLPKDGDKIYLSKEHLFNKPLYLYDGTPLQPFIADDLQDNKWDISIKINPDSNSDGIFKVVKIGHSRAELQITNPPNYSNNYKLELICDCECDGSAPSTTSINIYISFISEHIEPVFIVNEVTYQFAENSTEVGQKVTFPKATFTDDEEEFHIFDIYYILKSDDSESFSINEATRELMLIEMLDREKAPTHIVKIVASKNSNGFYTNEKSILTVTIDVLDVNDNPPNFDNSTFFAGIKSSDELNKKILKLAATDLDLKDSLSFFIPQDSFTAHGEGINDIKQPFIIIMETGEILLNFALKANMNGYFLFNVSVHDEAAHSDTAMVKIFIIAEKSKVTFQFENVIADVIPKEHMIKDIMKNHIGYLCNIDLIQKGTNENGEPVDTITDLSMHFIDENKNEAVNGSEIQHRIGDIELFAQLRADLLKNGLYLLTFTDPPQKENIEDDLWTWLIVVSVILGTLCIILTVVFILKIRSLRRRLNKLSTPTYGAQDSDFNQISIPPPTTNKRADGSNPVYNEKTKMPDIDAISTISGDSDLIGVEDNPNFQYDGNIWGNRNQIMFKHRGESEN